MTQCDIRNYPPIHDIVESLYQYIDFCAHLDHRDVHISRSITDPASSYSIWERSGTFSTTRRNRNTFTISLTTGSLLWIKSLDAVFYNYPEGHSPQILFQGIQETLSKTHLRSADRSSQSPLRIAQIAPEFPERHLRACVNYLRHLLQKAFKSVISSFHQ